MTQQQPKKSSLKEKEKTKEVGLKREFGLFGGICIIVGTMIGSGIFVSPVGVLRNVGSIGASLVVWFLCGLIATCGSLTYAELGTMIPRSGAEYPYLKEAFGPVPAFLFAWTSSTVIKPSNVAIVAIVFGEYLIKPFFLHCDEIPNSAIKLTSAVSITLVTFLNCYSVKIAEKTQNIFTTAKLLVLLVIIGTGCYALHSGETDNLSHAFNKPLMWSTVGTSFYQGLWAYDGWNQLNYITEELQNPYVNLPRALGLGIPLVTLVYLLTNVAYLAGLSLMEIMASRAVAVTFGSKFLGSTAWIIPLGVAFSTFGSINGFTITGPRITYTASRFGHMPAVFGMIQFKHCTPVPAILFQNFIALLVIIPNDFDTLVNYFSFSMWLFHGGSALALIVLRVTQPKRRRPYKVPVFIPVFVVLVALYLVIYPIVLQPAMEYLYATLFILCGLIFYFPLVYCRKKMPFIGFTTKYVQLLLQVAPPVKSSEMEE